MPKKQRKTYTAAERKAYWIGVGMALGRFTRKGDISFLKTMTKREEVFKSCEAGYQAEKGCTPPSRDVLLRGERK